MSSAPTYTGLFPTVFGGAGMGYGVPAVVYGTEEKPPARDAAPMADDPTPRGMLPSGSWFGHYPGFGSAPAGLTTVTAWAMRRYPMVVKVHARLTKPVLASTRAIEVDCDDEKLAADIKKAAEQDLLPALEKALPGAMEAPHFGHFLQEVVWERRDGRLVPGDIRSILPAEGVIHVDAYWRFTGFQIGGEYRDARYAYLAVNDPHIDPVLGASWNEAALTAWFRATKSAENADSVERKAAGIQLILQVQQGVTFKDAAGNVVDWASLGTQWMNAAAQGKSVIVPAMAFPKDVVQSRPELAKVPLVNIDRFDWGNTGPALEAHLKRLAALNVDVCSAWGVPERAVMEAEHGSKADAEAHSDVVLAISELLHTRACTQWDEQVTQRWLAANFGAAKARVRTVPAPLADPQQQFFQDLVKALASNDVAAEEMIAHVDKRHLMERVEVPLLSEEDAKKAMAEAEKKKQAADAQKAKQLAKVPAVKE